MSLVYRSLLNESRVRLNARFSETKWVILRGRVQQKDKVKSTLTGTRQDGLLRDVDAHPQKDEGGRAPPLDSRIIASRDGAQLPREIQAIRIFIYDVLAR